MIGLGVPVDMSQHEKFIYLSLTQWLCKQYVEREIKDLDIDTQKVCSESLTFIKEHGIEDKEGIPLDQQRLIFDFDPELIQNIQKYFGIGPKLVRELFHVSEEHAPSIVFIDEIDDHSNSGSEHEIQKSMLELLNQLDGFDSRDDVKVTMAIHQNQDLNDHIDESEGIK